MSFFSALRTKFGTKNLAQRVGSALVLMPLVLGAVWLGGAAYALLVILAMLVGLSEWLNLTAPKLEGRGVWFAFAGLVLIFAAFYLKGLGQAVGLALFAGFVLAFYVVKAAEGRKGALRDGMWAGLGVPYLALSGLGLLLLRADASQGLGFIVYLLLVVWGTDIGAYFAGLSIGGPKILPKISPKKTWAGLVGGMALAGLLGYGVAHGFDESNPLGAAFLAMLLAVVAQAGDFLESHIKRRAGAKDSGTLIPGHGGLLDRIDGLLSAALVMALVKVLWG